MDHMIPYLSNSSSSTVCRKFIQGMSHSLRDYKREVSLKGKYEKNECEATIYTKYVECFTMIHSVSSKVGDFRDNINGAYWPP